MGLDRRASSLLTVFVLSACAAAPSEPPASTPSVSVVPEPTPPGAPDRVEPARREGFPLGEPATEGIDRAALDALVAEARAQHSEALVVVKNGKLVVEEYFGFEDEPIMAMSASKSFTALAFAFLLEEKKLASLDEPVAKIVPGFATADPRKANITYRHLLTQTSGIDPKRATGSKRDIEARGIAASCLFEPGSSWQYSNAGFDLLAALAGKLAGRPMDRYLNEKLFRPLGIADVVWMRDKKGVPLGAGEMEIRPLDMAKIGQALLAGGRWASVQVIPKTWPELSFAPSSMHEPLYGLSWWRVAPVTAHGLTTEVIAQWRTAGLADAIAAKLEALVGRRYATYPKYQAALRSVLDRNELQALDALVLAGDHLPTSRNLEVGPATAFDAAGWLGQFLVVVPDKQLVAVRMRRARASDYDGPEVDGFGSFPTDVPKLVP